MAKTKRKSVGGSGSAPLPVSARKIKSAIKSKKKSKKEAATASKRNVEKALEPVEKPEETETRASAKSAKKDNKSKRKRDGDEEKKQEENTSNKKAAVEETEETEEAVVSEVDEHVDRVKLVMKVALPSTKLAPEKWGEGDDEKTVTSHSTKLSMPLSKGGAQRSLPASRRWWKSVETHRSSMQEINANKRTMSSTWDKKMAERTRRKQLKEYETELLSAKMARIEAEKAKKLEKKNRKAANEFKSSKFQVIKDMSKIKKMSKKQLRMIHKTRVDEAGNTITVPLYA